MLGAPQLQCLVAAEEAAGGDHTEALDEREAFVSKRQALYLYSNFERLMV